MREAIWSESSSGIPFSGVSVRLARASGVSECQRHSDRPLCSAQCSNKSIDQSRDFCAHAPSISSNLNIVEKAQDRWPILVCVCKFIQRTPCVTKEMSKLRIRQSTVAFRDVAWQPKPPTRRNLRSAAHKSRTSETPGSMQIDIPRQSHRLLPNNQIPKALRSRHLCSDLSLSIRQPR